MENNHSKLFVHSKDCTACGHMAHSHSTVIHRTKDGNITAVKRVLSNPITMFVFNFFLRFYNGKPAVQTKLEWEVEHYTAVIYEC